MPDQICKRSFVVSRFTSDRAGEYDGRRSATVGARRTGLGALGADHG